MKKEPIKLPKKSSSLLTKKGIQRHMSAKTPAIHTRMTREEFADIIEQHYGIVTCICNIIDCTFKQFYQAVHEWKLEEHLEQSKQNLVALAEQVVLEKMMSKSESISLKAAEITLRSQMGKKNGWGTDGQMSITQNIVSDEDKGVQVKNIFGIQ